MKTNKNDQSVSFTASFGKVMRVIGHQRRLLAASVFFAAVSVILQLYIPMLFGDAIDYIAAKNRVDFAMVAAFMGRILLLTAIAATATWLMNIINNRLAYRTVQEIRSRAIRKIQRLPLSFLDANSEGDLVQRVIADVDQISDGLILGFTQFFSGLIMIVITIAFMFSRSRVISLMVLLLTPLSFFLARFISTHTYAMFNEMTRVRGQQTALVGEMIGGEKLVSAFAYQSRASRRFNAINRDLQKSTVRAIFYSSLANPGTRAVNAINYALVALVGAFTILQGGLTVGGLTILLTYTNQYTKPFNDLSMVYTELQNAMACAARVFYLIEAEPESKDVREELPPATGRVNIEHVNFSYSPDRPLIEDFDLHVSPGQTIAIVGPTGCGKTTLINLLMRFYDVNSGSIMVDGKDIRSVSRHSLRRSYGMVLQESWLRNASLRDNIALGKADASDEEIIAACKKAHSWDFIRRLPRKLDTIVHEDDLSQGQRQLLCISRVMLCMPPMLILDEATSSIDTRTEILIQAAFDQLMAGRTSFIVAHRLSTVRNADLILVMKDGHIVEQGRHEDLIAANGFYTRLYQAQFAGISI